MSEGQGKQRTFVEYLFIGVVAFLSVLLVLGFLRGERSNLILLGAAGGIGLIVLVVWVIVRTSFSRSD